MRLRQSRRSSADLADIYEHGAKTYGVKEALGYIEGIERRLLTLLDYPRSGRADDRLITSLRSLPFQAHRIYYRIDGDTIMIHRILHMAADVKRHLE